MAPKAAEGPERSWAGVLFPSGSQEGILSSSAIKAVSVPDQVPDPLLHLLVCHQLDSLLRKKGDRPSNSHTAPPDAGRRGRRPQLPSRPPGTALLPGDAGREGTASLGSSTKPEGPRLQAEGASERAPRPLPQGEPAKLTGRSSGAKTRGESG